MTQRLALLLALSLLLGSATAAQRRYVDVDRPAGGSGVSWGTAYADLQLALAEARVDSSIQEVWVAEGRYLPTATGNVAIAFELVNGLAVYGGFAGTETQLAQRDPGLHPTVLDGDLLGDDQPGFGNYADNARQVVRALDLDASAVLDGFIVRGGNLDPGAGIQCIRSTPKLANLVVRDNSGIGNINSGGGMWALLDPGQFLVLTDCAFEANRSTAGGGLQVRAIDGGDVLLERCRFADNTATDGAGLRLTGPWIEQPRLRVDVIECSFEGNAGTSGPGLSLGSEDRSELAVLRSEFRGNVACSGAALRSSSEVGNDVTLEACTFVGNGPSGGCGVGAGGAVSCLGGTLNLFQCTFLDNRRGHLALVDVSATLLSCTLFQTIPHTGMQLDGATVLTLSHSIVWGSGTQLLGAAVAGAGVAHSDVHMDGVPLPGEGNLDVDPLLVDPAGEDLHLAPGSPCVDAGHPAYTFATTDPDGDPRVLDGDLDGVVLADIGADELANLHLAFAGPLTGGATVTVTTQGPPGLVGRLLVGNPGAFFAPRAGVVLVSLAGATRLPWPIGASVPVTVPPGLSGPASAQLVGFGGGTVQLSNVVRLEF